MGFGGEILEGVKNTAKSWGKIMKPQASADRLAGLYATEMKGNLATAREMLLKNQLEEGALRKAGMDTKAVANDLASAVKKDPSLGSDIAGQIEHQKKAYRTQMDATSKKVSALENAQGDGAGMLGKAKAIADAKGIKGVGGIAKEYYWGEGLSAKEKAVRIGTTYAAGALGGRVLSGGGLTTNSTGERDIAGIPFV